MKSLGQKNKNFLDENYTNQPLQGLHNYTSRGFGTTQKLSLQGYDNQIQLPNMKTPTASMFARHDKRARSIALNPLNSNDKHYRTKGESPGGIYLEDIKRRSHHIDQDNSSEIVDFIKKNLSIAKEQKNVDFERSKEIINKIHSKILKRRDYSLDLNNLSNIQSCLNPRLKQHFLGHQGYYQIFSEANVMNSAFLQIIDQVSCYRLELGIIFQKMVEAYNSIILMQFEEFYKSESDKEKELKHKLVLQQQAADDLFSKKLEYEKRMESVQAIIQGKDAQIQSLETSEQQLEQEVKYLRELLQIDAPKRQQSSKDQMDQMMASSKTDIRKRNISVDSKKDLKSNFQNERVNAKDEFAQNIDDLNEVLKHLEHEQQEKKSILNATKISVGTQVEDGELQWKPQHYLGDSAVQILSNKSTLKGTSSKQLTSIDTIPKQNQQSAILKNVQNVQSNQDIEPAISEEQKASMKFQYTSPMEQYGSTQKVLLLKEEDRINELETKLNQLINSIKNPEADKSADNQFQWSIPTHILIFIANSLMENQSGRVLPWQEFKTIIYDIYDNRINSAPELNGIINNTYVNLEEFILLYFLDKYKLRRLAEIKIIETLTSLKYYLEIWPRAKMFANLLNLLKPQKHSSQASGPKSRQQNQANALTELFLPNIDIYLQEFFLHSYSLLLKDKDHFLESKDGQTFVKVAQEENATQLLMIWFVDQDQRKWFHKVRRNVKKIKTSPVDDFETDYIDIDILLNMYVEEYKTKKKSNQKNLSKEFMKRFQEQEGLFNTEEVDKIVQSCMPSISPSAFVKFPGLVSIRRAFLYSLVCGENGFDINTQEFIAGCNRFGLDNPSPFVTKRIALYGNDEDLEDLMKRELAKQNVQAQSKMHASKIQKPGIKIESARMSAANIKSIEPPPQQSPRIQVGIQNLKLMGRVQTADFDNSHANLIISGGVKLSIGQLGKDQEIRKGGLTNEETSIGNKKIIIPSFSTTSALFSQHFSILRDLKKRIDGLKQAYYNQREEERSWEQVEKILHVLEAACKFLDFPIQQ